MSVKYKKGDLLIFSNCTCGDDLREGYIYKVVATQGDLFMFIDSSGNKRVRNMNSKCFKRLNNLTSQN